MTSSRICSSFHGNIWEIPEIFVDNFETLHKKAYFLSHCHEDHVKGLFSLQFLDYLRDSGTFIYTSEISAEIIYQMTGGNLSRYIKPLKLGSTLITIKSDDSDDEEDNDLYLNVSLIPAGHCFGSVMFLFRTSNLTVLYTGDFRINQSDISKYNQLLKNNEPIDIDVMYIDTTFQDEEYEEFPKRSETVNYAIDEIKKWLDEDKDGSRYVALHTSGRFLHEFIFNEIYSELKMKIFVPYPSWELYSQFPDIFKAVTRNCDSRIHQCSDWSNNGNHKYCDINPDFKQFLYVHFSAFSWRHCDTNAKMLERYENKLAVCFATHCSRSELRAFVNYFSPKKIVGFREPYRIVWEPKKVYNDMLIKSPPKKVVCKREGVRKVPKDLLKKMFED